jgi:hypothetical protein
MYLKRDAAMKDIPEEQENRDEEIEYISEIAETIKPQAYR